MNCFKRFLRYAGAMLTGAALAGGAAAADIDFGKPGSPVELVIGYQPYYTESWSGIVMRGTLHSHAPKTYSGQWPRQTASNSKGDSRSIARKAFVPESLSTAPHGRASRDPLAPGAVASGRLGWHVDRQPACVRRLHGGQEPARWRLRGFGGLSLERDFRRPSHYALRAGRSR